jgi:hypothetical protein
VREVEPVSDGVAVTDDVSDGDGLREGVTEALVVGDAVSEGVAELLRVAERVGVADGCWKLHSAPLPVPMYSVPSAPMADDDDSCGPSRFTLMRHSRDPVEFNA